MKILVTGGKGVIGTQLVTELVKRGYDVTSIDLDHSEKEVGFSVRTDVYPANYIRADVAEYRQLKRVFETCGEFDYVYHTAAEFGRWNGEDFYETLWRSNAIGTKNIIRLQEEYGFKLIHFSSSEVYGDYPNIMAEEVMDETEVKQMNDYAMSKWVNEMQIHNSRKQYGTESVIVRIFNTYGPGEYYSPYRSVNCRILYCALAGIPWLVYRNYGRTSTYLVDTVQALSNIVLNFKDGETYNIGGNHYHTIEELSDIIIDITGASPDLVDYLDNEVLTTRHKRVDNSKAVKDLGLQVSVSLRDGLIHTMDWMNSVYKF